MSFYATATELCWRAGRKALVWLRAVTGYREDHVELGQVANRYWNDPSRAGRAQDAHWRGHGPFAVDDVWLKMGRDHKDMLHRVLRSHGENVQRARQVVEWGCGGGMNAVQFARDADVYYGIDVSVASLDECSRQMHEGPARFVPVLVTVNDPRTALQAIGGRCDLFICTYVIELLPTESHALELIDLAAEILESGGYALIQTRCTLGGIADRSRPWDYAGNMAHNVTFSVPAFQAACMARGFAVLGVEQRDAVPEINEKNYAYFVLKRQERG